MEDPLVKKFNNYLLIGLALVSLTFVLKHVTIVVVPDAMMGFLLGIGIALELIGVYTMNHSLAPIKNFKRTLYNKFVKR
jgi:hypothetical protein